MEIKDFKSKQREPTMIRPQSVFMAHAMDLIAMLLFMSPIRHSSPKTI